MQNGRCLWMMVMRFAHHSLKDTLVSTESSWDYRSLGMCSQTFGHLWIDNVSTASSDATRNKLCSKRTSSLNGIISDLVNDYNLSRPILPRPVATFNVELS